MKPNGNRAATTRVKQRWSRSRGLRMFRRLVSRSHRRGRELVVKLATTRDERSEALRLLHDAYVRAGLTDAHVSGMRVTPYHVLPTTRIVIAQERGRVVGTLSIFRRTPSSELPAERLFHLSALGDDRDVEEYSSLAVAPSSQRDGEVLFELFRFAVADSLRRSVDLLVATFHPRHRHLYEAILGFEPLAERAVRSYDFVNGAPAMGAYLHLQKAQEHLAAMYGTDDPWTPYTWFFGGEEDVVEPEFAFEPVLA